MGEIRETISDRLCCNDKEAWIKKDCWCNFVVTKPKSYYAKASNNPGER